MELTTKDIITALKNAEIHGPANEVMYRGVTTDTRKTCTGALFVALSGENFDGNAYLAQAKDSGALGAVISSSALKNPLPEYFQCFLVQDTLCGLQNLAGYVRQRHSSCRVVAVTGSNGKSTTKEMIAAALRCRYITHATSGNYNNHIGVPLTILGIGPETEFLVTEIGANHPGEIRPLARLAKPATSVITNVAPAHLEGFGSVEGVLRAKLELFEETLADGFHIYNGNDELLNKYVPARFSNTVSFGIGNGFDIKADGISLDSSARASFTIDNSLRITLQVPGRHNIYNALAAAAVGRSHGLTDSEIKAGLESVRPMKMRTNLRIINDITVLDDSYNANPYSMKEALKTLEAIDHKGMRGIVAGEMRELGEHSRELHIEIAQLIASKPLKPVLMVGRYAIDMKEAYLASGGSPDCVFTADDADSAALILQEVLSGGELLLVKGSRGMQLERVIERLEKIRC